MSYPRIAMLLTALISATCAVPAWACSTCKCADNTITLFGTEKAYTGRFRLALDHYLRSEVAGSGAGRQVTDEARSTLGLGYSLTADLTLAVQIPFVRKEIEAGNLARQEASGLGDVDVTARWVLYRSGALTGRHLAGLRGGVRLPTADEVKDNGVKLNIDVQPDAGATAPNLGAWYSYYRFPWFATASATYFTFTEGHQDFQGGDALIVSVLGQYAVSEKLALQLGVDARDSDKNAFSGVADADSGGFLAMGYVGLVRRLGDDLLLYAGYQSPLVERLNGEQEEGNALRVGLTYDL
jgi:hypothetical protein